MIAFFARLALAWMAEAFCHRIDPGWRSRRARKRLFVAATSGVSVAMRTTLEPTRVLAIGGRYRRLAPEEEE